MSSTPGRRPARSPRAARSREQADRQTLMVRRSIGLGAAVVAIIVLVFGINSCLDSRKERAFEDYASDVRALVQGSSQISDRLFTLLSKPSRADALDVQTQVNAERAEAEQLVQRAREHRPSGRAERRQRLAGRGVQVPRRRDQADRRAAARRRSATSGDSRRDQFDRGPDAGAAGKRRDLSPADHPEAERPPTTNSGIEERFPTDRFLPDLGWLDPDTVETRLSRIPARRSEAATPGLHGTGSERHAFSPPAPS